MKEIKHIVFDFGGVLLDWNPRYLYRTYFEDANEMEYFLAHICTDAWNAEQDRGRPFSEGVKLLQAQYPAYKDAIRLYADRWEEMLHAALPDGVQLLRELKGKGYHLWGLTNWSAETIPIAYRKHDFFQLFEGIVVSGEEKLIKPDKRIYEVLLNRYNLHAEESVFLDDNCANIEAAQALGFHAILFDEITNVRAQLAAVLKPTAQDK